MLTKVADLAATRPRQVIAATVVLAIVAAALGGNVASRLSAYGSSDPATESYRTTHELQDATGLEARPRIILLVRAQSRRKVARIAAIARADRAVGRVVTYYDTRSRAMLSRDGRSTYLAVWLRAGADDKAAVGRLERSLAHEPGTRIGGFSPTSKQVQDYVREDLRHAEELAVPLLVLLSLWFFRSAVAALLPPLVGGVAIVLTFLGLRIASEWINLSVLALNLVVGLGLGLAIDYSLFVVSRYREEIAARGAGRDALLGTVRTAGRTVLLSSLTVAAAMASMLVFPQKFLRSMGVGGVIVVLMAATVALVALPALLSLLGERVNALSPAWLRRAADAEARPASAGFWYRLSRYVMRRPGRIAVLSAGLLIALGLPFFGIRFVAIDDAALPDSAPAHQVDQALATEFPPNPSTAIVVAAHAPDGPRVRAYARRLRAMPEVAAVDAPRQLAPALTRIDVVSRTGRLSDDSQRLVRRIRSRDEPFAVGVTGDTANFLDLKSSLGHHLPLALLLVAGTTATVLFLMTGSVVLPLKGLVMNVLSLSAAFGLLVLIFQDGRLEGLLRYKSQGALEATQPVLLFALAFGLSTDYGVFLLARIKEARDAGASDRESVAMGLERTGRIVSAAALLFCVAVGAFATSRIIFVKELGVGTALAVIIDATIVRALLVPALMELLGRWNWWAPRPLRRLHRRLGLAEPAGPVPV